MIRRCAPAVLLLLLALPLGGCLFRSHRVPLRMSTAQLKTASRQELIDLVNQQAAKIQTLDATVDIAVSVGGSQKGKVTEYKEIRGYILVRRPDMLRMVGLMPIVRNRAFDMVSDGKNFKLWMPTKNEFVVGRNEVSRPAKQPLENLRPQHIYDSLLLHEINPENQIAVLEQGNEEVQDPKTHKQVIQPNYVLDVIQRGEQGWYLARKIMFSRTDLNPERQIIYDLNGYVTSDVHYEDFQNYNGVMFPSTIEIWRPAEEYSVTLNIVKLTINKPLSNEQFALNQPPGSQLVDLDNPASTAQLPFSTPAPR